MFFSPWLNINYAEIASIIVTKRQFAQFIHKPGISKKLNISTCDGEGISVNLPLYYVNFKIEHYD